MSVERYTALGAMSLSHEIDAFVKESDYEALEVKLRDTSNELYNSEKDYEGLERENARLRDEIVTTAKWLRDQGYPAGIEVADIMERALKQEDT